MEELFKVSMDKDCNETSYFLASDPKGTNLIENTGKLSLE